ncbi:MAG TPA: acyltransferase [Polyangiaceae bacterium]|nr:acyltransferase [Polyangiaceae bacterium]
MAKVGFHIPSLDGLRTFSFAVVFAAHAGLYYVIPGGFGVTVFFFLSGFLITTLLRMEFDKTGHVSLRKFYVRRALRILPPFYLVLFAATALVALGALAGPVNPKAVLAQALHYANYYIVSHGAEGFAPGTAVYWSLAVEEHFYLLFPLLYLSLRKRGVSGAAQALTLGALCALILCWRCVLVYGLHSATDRTYMASDTRFDSILYGCALAVFGNPVLDPSRFSDGVWKRLLLPLGLLGLLASFLIRGAEFRETVRYSLQGLALIPVFVCAMRFSTWGPFKVLNYRPIAFIGVLSYSLYLIHQVVLFALEPILKPRIGAVSSAFIGLGVSLTLAWLVHLYVEQPFARLRKRYAAGG